MLTTKSLQSTDCPMRTLEAMHTTFQTQAVQLIPSALDRCLLCLQHHLPLPMKLPHTDKCRLVGPPLSDMHTGSCASRRSPCEYSTYQIPPILPIFTAEASSGNPPWAYLLLSGRRTLMASLLPGDLPDKLLYGVEGWYPSPLTRLKCSFHLKPWPVHI